MRGAFLIFFLSFYSLQGDPTKPMAAPLLTLSEIFPVEISPENRRNFLLNEKLDEQEALRNVEILQQRQIPWLPILALTASFVLLVTAQSRKGKKEIGKKISKKDAKKSAIQSLNYLEKKLQKQQYEEFYVDLTRMLHTYIEEYYHIPADTRTTEEFLKDITLHPIFDKKYQDSLIEILEIADRIKFSHFPTTNEETERVLQLTRAFITLEAFDE